MEKNKISVEVAYAKPEKQYLAPVKVEVGSTIAQAIRQSGILALFPEIDLTHQNVGVFGKRRVLSDKVNPGDRIEIYRPLLIDPKAARRIKAQSSK